MSFTTTTRRHNERSPPGRQIRETIANEQIDLVVLGDRGHGMIGRLLVVGRTSENILAHAPCSVLIVRE